MNWFSKHNPQALGRKKSDDDKEETVMERHSKILIKLPELFSGNASEWPAWKISARLSFR